MQSKRFFVILITLVSLVAAIVRFSLYPPQVSDGLASSGGSRILAEQSQTEKAPLPAQAQSAWYTVARVIDGDTVVLDRDGALETVRLIGLDTPEVVAPKKPVQCFGPEASVEAEKLLSDQVVRLEADPTQSARDVYGRTLAYLFLPDGTNFSEQMLAGGYGREYTFKKPYRYQAEFRAAEGAAKKAGSGLWGACKPLRATQ